MKKMFFLMVFLAEVLIMSGMVFAACTDSDISSDTINGKNYYTYGTTCVGSSCSYDFCNSAGKLIEYYCSGDSLAYVTVACPTGNICSSGACVSPNQIPDFTLSVSPSSNTIYQTGDTGSHPYTIHITSTNGFGRPITFTLAGAPQGVTTTIPIVPVTPTVNGAKEIGLGIFSTNTPTGTHTLTITGTSDSITKTTTATLIVQACTPKTCSQLTPPKECGGWDNSCGGTATCSCPSDKYCKNGVCDACVTWDDVIAANNAYNAGTTKWETVVQTQTGYSTHSCTSTPTCTDNTKNGAETDIDCGGGTCPTCANDKTCSVDSDCSSNYCNPSTKKCETQQTTCTIKCTPGQIKCIQGTTNYLECGADGCWGTTPMSCEDGKVCINDVNGIGSCQTATCTDSDGLNINEPGITTFGEDEYKDSCLDKNNKKVSTGKTGVKILETVCSISPTTKQQVPKSSTFSCLYGCSVDTATGAGFCIQKSESTECTDTDKGMNIYEMGTVTDKKGEHKDSCSGATLTENYCYTNTQTSPATLEWKPQTVPCPSGCKDGACIKQAETSGCTDPDLLNIYTATTVTSTNTNGPASITDTCTKDGKTSIPEGKYVLEAVCVPDITSPGLMKESTKKIKCPSGTCSGGKCIQPCVDKDLRNRYTKNTVIYYGQEAGTDTCTTDGNKVTEYYCSVDKDGKVSVLNKDYTCKYGCENGACNKNPNIVKTCEDSDNGAEDYTTKGKVTVCINGKCKYYNDGCSGTKKVRERYCSGNNVKTKTASCPSGTTCSGGACIATDQITGAAVALTSKCTDTDGGKNYYVKGTVAYKGRQYTDKCMADGKSLVEYSCSNTGKLLSEKYKCDPYPCKDGACVKPVCEPTQCPDGSYPKCYVENGQCICEACPAQPECKSTQCPDGSWPTCKVDDQGICTCSACEIPTEKVTYQGVLDILRNSWVTTAAIGESCDQACKKFDPQRVCILSLSKSQTYLEDKGIWVINEIGFAASSGYCTVPTPQGKIRECLCALI